MKYPVFFDYIWYRVYSYYNSKNDTTAILSASFTLSLGQTSNILSILFPINYFYNDILILNKTMLLCIGFAILFLSFFRFRKKKIAILNDKWENESSVQKRNRGFLVMLYLILSLAVMIGIAGYLGSLRNR